MGILDPVGISALKLRNVNNSLAMRSVPHNRPFASAPTPSFSSTSGITNPYIVNAVTSFVIDTSNFLYFGMNPKVAGPQSPAAGGVVGDNLTSSNGGSAGVGVATKVDSRYIEFPVRCLGQAIRITVSGPEGEEELLNAANDRATGVALAGTTNTIQLASTDTEPVSGGYNTAYIFITSGTGTGQVRQISGFDVSTKIVTVSSPWTIVPDITSNYRVNQFSAPFSIPSDNAVRYILIDMGVRGVRTFTYESTAFFTGIRIDSSGSLTKPRSPYSIREFNIRDSFGEGAGGGYAPYNGAGAFLARRYGWEHWHGSAGGTGFLATNGGTRLNYRCRIVPPVNSWLIDRWAVTAGGTYTLTQGSITTGAIAWNAAYTAVQTAMDTAFGANVWKVVQHPYYGYVAIGLGSNQTNTAPMTVTLTGITGVLTVRQFVGDIAPNVPVDVAGRALPFIINLAGSLNDDGAVYPTSPVVFPLGGPSSGTSLTDIQAEVTYVAAECVRRWPTAIVILSGRQMNNGPAGLQSQRDNNAALEAASLTLPKLNGQVPFAKTMDSTTGVGYIRGTTTVAIPGGVAGINAEQYVFRDQTHYVVAGYKWMDEVWASSLDVIFLNPN